MTLNDLIKITNEGYPDGYLAMYWNFEDEDVNQDPTNKLGDTLALFLVRELKDTYDPDMTDAEQLREAQYAIDNALDQLLDVRNELDKVLVKVLSKESKRLLKEAKHA